MTTLLRNFRVVDFQTDTQASVFLVDGKIEAVLTGRALPLADRVIDGALPDGRTLCLMPAFVDMHTHLRDPGFLAKETLESGSLAAARGGFGTLVCMANTNPVIDTVEAAVALANRASAIGLIDLYPALSLTKGMEGKELSGLKELHPTVSGTSILPASRAIRLVSEDGRDVKDDALFKAAMREARRLGLAVSVHCDALGHEDASTERALQLGAAVGVRLHIAHVSTKRSVYALRDAKARLFAPGQLSAEATPHHLALTVADAQRLGADTAGKVAPPLRLPADRAALMEALEDGTIDVIATDHAPHTPTDKAAGSPGFIGLETAFGVCNSLLVQKGNFTLSGLSRLMAASPAALLGLKDRGAIAKGLRADLVALDPEIEWEVDDDAFASRSRNSPFIGRILSGKVAFTLHGGRIVYEC